MVEERGRLVKVKRFGGGRDGHNTWRMKSPEPLPPSASSKDIGSSKSGCVVIGKAGDSEKAR
jgi:hypothetical protein